MEQNENYLDMIINSLRYSVSDLRALFWGGIAALGTFILIGLPFMFGYVTRCGREVLHGNGTLPPWDNLGKVFKDGIMIVIAMLIFGLISGLLYVLVVPFIVVGALAGSDLLLLAGLLMLMPAIAISIILGLLMPAAWVEYAVTGDLARALNPANAIRAAAKNPLAYIGAVIAVLIVRILLTIPAALVVTIPWVICIQYTSSAYIFAWFYRQTQSVTPVARASSPAAAAI